MTALPSTLCAAFGETVGRYPDRVALRTLDGVEITWAEYADRMRVIASALAALGIGAGDTVAMMLTNRPETCLVDTAALHLRATPFSIYNTSSPEQIEYLLNHAESRVVVTERQFADRVEKARSALAGCEHVFVVDDPCSMAELERRSAAGFDLAAAAGAVQPDDVAVLVYTSGTTGPPKGVELTHANVIAEFRMAQAAIPIRQCGRLVSYLPMAHLADRAVAHYPALLTGSSITFVPDATQIVAALPEVRPTLWVGVPRIWEKLKAALEAGFAAAPERAVDAAAVRRSLGLDEADMLVSGSAPIAGEVLDFFAGLGLPICETWAMTETAAGGTINRPDSIRVGTVGQPLPGCEVQVAPDGELLIRGPHVMRGYRKDPEQTAEAVDADGWMHTGDLGTIDGDGYVRITGRKKELIINAAGKNMSPNNIEAAVKAESGLIGQVMAVGDRRPYNTALIVLESEAARSFAVQAGIEDTTFAALAANTLVQSEVAAAVERGNARLSRVEQIKRFTILPVDWVASSDELTPTMKLRRAAIAEKYAAEIEEMYC